MKIKNLADGAHDFTGNVWLVENEDNKALVDVGTGDSWERISELENLDSVVITHSHYDHIENLEKIENAYSPSIYAFDPGNLSVKASELVEGDSVELCGIKLNVFHTPGHKDDSMCLYYPEERILFTGDLIFPEGGFGRTDLEEGDREKLISSIEKIDELEVERFYPGHGNAVTENAEDWIQRSLEEAKKKEPKY